MSTQARPAPTTPEPEPSRLRFGHFEADLRARELLRDGERVPLQDRPFEVLAALLERPGEVVLRQELQDRLWPGQIVEFDNNLNTALTKLRRALDDTGEAPSLIETLPKRGYRLMVPVERVSEVASETPGGASKPVGLGRWLALGLGLAALVTALAIGWRAAGAPESVEEPQVAAGPARTSLLVVLPFVALDEAEADERLADVLTEELINRLAELLPSELGVIARTSAMSFKGAAVDVATIRRSLGVDYLLEGSVTRNGSAIEVRARFIHAADQAHLWAETYDVTLDELPRVQRSIAQRIASGVSAELRSGGALTPEQSITPEAWEAYLQARFSLTAALAPSREEIDQAVDLLRSAVEMSPDFALAWAALADAVYRQSGPAPERHETARVAAERALELDPSLARPRHRLATLALYQSWDWEESGRQFDWAISLAPNLAVIHHSRAAWYSTQGLHDAALASIDRALELDPLSVVLHADAGWYLFVARRYEEAIERCRQAIELVPDHRGANSYLLHSLVALGRTEQAAEVARRLLEIEGAERDIRVRAVVSSEAALLELREYRLAVLEAERAEGLASPGRVALAHVELGDTERALDLLEAGLASRWGWIYPFLGVYPLLDPLAGDLRFERLVDEVGAPRPPDRIGQASTPSSWIPPRYGKRPLYSPA